MLISIAIPTYNRASKLARLLDNLVEQIIQSENLRNQVEIVVSDNCSTDETLDVLTDFDYTNIHFRFYRQQNNLGFDGNVKFLYEKCSGAYIWFIADDDLLFLGSVEKIFDTLTNYSPTVLLFSFIQPKDHLWIDYGYNNDVELISDAKIMIKHLFETVKISAYVIKNQILNDADYKVINSFSGSGYMHIVLSCSSLQHENNPSMRVLTKPLASCDDDFKNIRESPEVWNRIWKVAGHPYVLKVMPNYIKEQKNLSQLSYIAMLFDVKMKRFMVEDEHEYIDASRRVKFNMLMLKNRGVFIKYLALKFDLNLKGIELLKTILFAKNKKI